MLSYSTLGAGVEGEYEQKLCVGLGAATCFTVMKAEYEAMAAIDSSVGATIIDARFNSDHSMTTTIEFTSETSGDAGTRDADVVIIPILRSAETC